MAAPGRAVRSLLRMRPTSCIAKHPISRSRTRVCARTCTRSGDLIGETLRDQGGDEFFDLVEGDRLAAIARREATDGSSELQRRTAGRSRLPPRT